MANITVLEALQLSLNATKKYVDDNKFSKNYEDLNNEPFTFVPIKLTETNESNGAITAYCDVFDLEQGHRYVADFTKYDYVCLYTFNSDNTKNTLVATTSYLSTSRNGMITIMISSATKRDILWMSAYGSEKITVTKNSDGTFTIANSLIVPRVTNTREFTPTSDYHLVHKKYVDEKVAEANASGGYTHPDSHPASMITGLATVATSGDYNDLTNRLLKVLPSNTTATDLYNLEAGVYLTEGQINFNILDDAQLYNGIEPYVIFPNSLIASRGGGEITNLSYGIYYTFNPEGYIVYAGTVNNAWGAPPAHSIPDELSDELPASTNAVKNYVDANKFSGNYNDLTNKPTIPSTEGLATETYVNNKVSELVDSAPETLDTLKELATALGNDANFATTISNQIGLKANSADLATVATSGDYNDLTNRPIKVLPDDTTVADLYNLEMGIYLLTNNIEFNITDDTNMENGVVFNKLSPFTLIIYRGNGMVGDLSSNIYYVFTSDGSLISAGTTNNSWAGTIATVATTGSYNDLTDKPTIPTKTSQLTNDSGFITSIPAEYITDTYLNNKLSGMPKSLAGHDGAQVLSYIDKHNVLERENMVDKAFQVFTSFSTSIPTSGDISNLNVNVVDFANTIMNACTEFGEDIFLYFDFILDFPVKFVVMSSSSSNMFLMIIDDGKTSVGLQIEFTGDGTGQYTRTSTELVSSNEIATVATSGNYNDLTNKPTIPTVTNDLTNALKSNYDKAYTHSQAAHAPSNAQKNSDITKAEIEAKLTGNITTHTHSQYLTEHQSLDGYVKTTDLSTVATTGSYNDLTDKPTIPSAYTHPNTHPASMITGLSKVATSGSYNDLSNKPTIPTIPDSLPANGGNADTVNNFRLWKGTQAQYDAITTKDSNTIYMITE